MPCLLCFALLQTCGTYTPFRFLTPAIGTRVTTRRAGKHSAYSPNTSCVVRPLALHTEIDTLFAERPGTATLILKILRSYIGDGLKVLKGESVKRFQPIVMRFEPIRKRLGAFLGDIRQAVSLLRQAGWTMSRDRSTMVCCCVLLCACARVLCTPTPLQQLTADVPLPRH